MFMVGQVRYRRDEIFPRIKSALSLLVFHIARAGETAQPFRALTAPPEDLGSNPSSHVVAHSLLRLAVY